MSRFYVDSVTGWAVNPSTGRSSHRGGPQPTLWYVMDTAPPRPSQFVGFGDNAKRDAERLAARLNERYG